MGINQLFDITRRSFRTLDAAMNVAGQNVANANTEGYSRQRLTLRPDSTTTTGLYARSTALGSSGTGVSVGSYDRLRDDLLGAAAQQARTGMDGSDEQYRILSGIESLFPTGDGGLTTLLDDFWDGWSDLADNPTDTGVRSTLLSRAESLTSTLNGLDAGLQQLQDETNKALDDGLTEANDLLDRIAALNTTIRNADAAGTPDFAAQDERDLLVKDLAGFMPVKVQNDDQGYTLSVGGMAVVQGDAVTYLERDPAQTDPPALRFAGTSVQARLTDGDDGKLGALLGTLTTTLPETRTALDDLASTLVEQVNTLHSGGFGLDGSTGLSFFDPATATAGSIQLSADVLGNPSALAASTDPDALGDSSNAQSIAALRTTALFGTDTPNGFVTNLVAGIGSQTSAAATKSAGQAAVFNQLDAMERGTSAVSIDEEMTQLIELQQAYGATARVLSTAQEMMDTLLRI